MWIGIFILLPHWFHKVFFWESNVAWNIELFKFDVTINFFLNKFRLKFNGFDRFSPNFVWNLLKAELIVTSSNLRSELSLTWNRTLKLQLPNFDALTREWKTCDILQSFWQLKWIVNDTWSSIRKFSYRHC